MESNVNSSLKSFFSHHRKIIQFSLASPTIWIAIISNAIFLIQVRLDPDAHHDGIIFSAGLAFSFAMSIGEFGATSFLTRRDSETLPISIASLFGKVGEIPRTTGMAASVLLLVLVAGVVLVIDRRSQI